MAINVKYAKKSEESQQFQVKVIMLGEQEPVVMVKAELNRLMKEGLCFDYYAELSLYWQLPADKAQKHKQCGWREEKREAKHREQECSIELYDDKDKEMGADDPELEKAMVHIDLERAKAKLDAVEKKICETILDGMTKAEGAAYCGLAPTTYQDKKKIVLAKLARLMA